MVKFPVGNRKRDGEWQNAITTTKKTRATWSQASLGHALVNSAELESALLRAPSPRVLWLYHSEKKTLRHRNKRHPWIRTGSISANMWWTEMPVCPCTWRLRTSPGWAQNPCGHCNDFRTEDKEACGSQLGVGLKGKWWHFQWAIKKEVGSDRTPSPCQCILFELDALQGRWVRLLFLFFHLLNPDTMWAEQTCGHVPLWSREPSWKEGY